MHKQVMDPGGGGADEVMIRAVERLVRYMRQSATTGGLSSAASSALARLGRAGPMRLTELARAESATQPNMTQLVTRMEKAGLVRRSAHASDGRGVVVAVTEEGQEVCDLRRAERAAALDGLLAELAGPEREAARLALPALGRVIEERLRREEQQQP